MGKYIRGTKSNLKPDPKVSTLDLSSQGVRTRAKTLALKKLEKSPAEKNTEMGFLQLRSRRLEKSPLTFCSGKNPNPNGGLVKCQESEEIEEEGENNIGFYSREQRSTRESTPCNSIKEMNVICTPGSSTRPRNLEASNRINQNSVARIMPLAHEIEEFFARHEQEQQRRFAEKYNFDIVNEIPLEGRYEWVRVQSQ